MLITMPALPAAPYEGRGQAGGDQMPEMRVRAADQIDLNSLRLNSHFNYLSSIAERSEC